jgi:general nucleoside transport system permease protein
MDYNVLTELLAATIRVAAPLLFVALGAVLSESAGTFAVGVEGMMLMGAFSGAVLTFVTKNWALGFLGSALSGAALASIVAIATARFRTDHMVTGLAVNVLALGLTSYLLRGLFGGKAPVINLPTFDAIRIPWLCNLPVIGHALFEQSLLTYTAFLLVVPMHFFLNKTQTGLMLRAVGENPAAAFSTGTDPVHLRMMAILFCGAFAGIGGAVLSLQELGTFTDGMTNGRGFIALAALIIGRWRPFWIMWACLLFGAASALAFNLQGWSLPISSYVIQMTPYLLALAVLCGIGRRARMPAAIGRAFIRD